MKLLLDTHTFLWLVDGNPKLSEIIFVSLGSRSHLDIFGRPIVTLRIASNESVQNEVTNTSYFHKIL